MGAVYQVADTRISGKTWALKEMSDAALTNPTEKLQAIEAFRREAELLSQLSHPNIPRVIDFFSERGKLYLVMDFVEGETLEDRIERGGLPLGESEVRPWAEQLCHVLGYLHSQQPPVIFRDLKPGNIMIDRTGHVKLIDIGIVRFFQPGKAKDTISFGTTGYAPPEQYGKGQTDARSDIYTLGATLHHLLTGRDPALTPFQFQPVRQLNPRVSLAMERAVMRALEQDPARRWSSAQAMWQAMTYTPPPPTPVPLPAPPVAPISHPRPALSPLVLPMNLAGFGRRALAFIIDNMLIATLYTLLFACPLAVVPNPTTPEDENLLTELTCVVSLLFLLLYVWYYIFLPARSGQTWGKKATGIRVIAKDGSPPGKARCFVRLIGYWLSTLILYIGFLMPLWDEEKQALHDKVASTYVVRT
jgi:serine/threonine protein kinase